MLMMPKRMTRRLGRFTVADAFFENMAAGDGANLFAGMVVLETRYDWNWLHRVYIAVHEQFRDLPNGEVIPEYEAIFSAGSSTPTWREKRS